MGFVCDPTMAYRPVCRSLVETFGHGPNCVNCSWANRPGSENRYTPRARNAIRAPREGRHKLDPDWDDEELAA